VVQQVLAVCQLPVQLLVQQWVHVGHDRLGQVKLNVLSDVARLLLQCEHPQLLLLCLNQLGLLGVQLSHLNLKPLLGVDYEFDVTVEGV
jgi:hypothetical protein